MKTDTLGITLGLFVAIPQFVSPDDDLNMNVQL